jgi:viologen exporter family transport system permease protein
VAGVLSDLDLYVRLIAASVRAQMQYRLNFAIRSFGDFLIVFADFLPLYFLLRAFGGLQGWTLAEIALLYGMVETSWATIEGSFWGFERFGPDLIAGRVDRWLLRPRGVILQVAAQWFEIRKLGRVAQGVLVLGIAIWVLRLDARAVAWVATGIAGGMLFFAGILVIGAATQFWTLGQTAELQNMLTYGGSAALTFPVSIYSTWFRRIVTYGVPLAFVNYFPALAALRRTAAAGWPAFVPWLSPVVCLVVLLLARAAFARGLRRYESTGS